MKKECCDIKVEETENGFNVKITGDEVKDKCKAVFEKCCTPENVEKCVEKCAEKSLETCCSTKK